MSQEALSRVIRDFEWIIQSAPLGCTLKSAVDISPNSLYNSVEA